MSMGGGGGAAQSPMDRAMAAYGAGITDMNELKAISQGMTPMSYENYMEGKQLVDSSLPDVKRYGKTMATLAGGGLLLSGMKQLNQMNKVPMQGTGIANRMAARYGIDASQEHGVNGNLDTSVSDASAKVAANNQMRTGLVNAMRGMRFSGIQV